VRQEADAPALAPSDWTWSIAADPAHVGALTSAAGDVQRVVAEANVQLRAAPGAVAAGGDVHATAARGVDGGGGRLPFHDRIQAAFGRHDLSAVRAHQGGAAAAATEALGARAYARGEAIAFADAPDLHTAAHEAAHVIQQRRGVSLSGGVGRTGDAYEREADRIADVVVRGESAEALLGAAGGRAAPQAIQRKSDGEGQQAIRDDKFVQVSTPDGYKNPDGTRRRELRLTIEFQSVSARGGEEDKSFTVVYDEGFAHGFITPGRLTKDTLAVVKQQVERFRRRINANNSTPGVLTLDARKLAKVNADLDRAILLFKELTTSTKAGGRLDTGAEWKHYNTLKQGAERNTQTTINDGSDRASTGTLTPEAPSDPRRPPPDRPTRPGAEATEPPTTEPPGRPPTTEPPGRPPTTEPPTTPTEPRAAAPVALRGVLFAFGKDHLSSEAKAILDGVAGTLRAHPEVVAVRVEGHADSKGSERFNQGLSQRRADAVVRYLVGKGIVAGRLRTAAFGESQAAASNATEAGRAENRRVTFHVEDVASGR